MRTFLYGKVKESREISGKWLIEAQKQNIPYL